MTEAGPSTPVEILGLADVPDAGSSFVVVADEATARQVAEHRRAKQREATLLKTSKVSLEDLYRQVQAGETKELRVVLKADVQGSVEALADALTRLSTDEVRLNVLHASVGGITESDVMLASASNAIVIGFNVRPEAQGDRTPPSTKASTSRLYDDHLRRAQRRARRDGRPARADVQARRSLAAPRCADTFTIPSIGTIAGCFVTDGKITRNAPARLVRDHVVVYTGKIGSLRRFKDDAREVQSGYECGIGLENFNDVKVGDVDRGVRDGAGRTPARRRSTAPPPKRVAAERARADGRRRSEADALPAGESLAQGQARRAQQDQGARDEHLQCVHCRM